MFGCKEYNQSDFSIDHLVMSAAAAAAAAKLLQSCPTLCDPIDCNPPGSSVHDIFQARVLEWGAIAFSNKQEQVLVKLGESIS